MSVGVQRNWTTGLNLREHLYRISVSLNGGSVYRYLPVTATRPDLPSDATETAPANAFTGLWFGQIPRFPRMHLIPHQPATLSRGLKQPKIDGI